MSKGVVIFSDGSKRMAHNNDDLNERWYERKIAAAEVDRLYDAGIFVPEFNPAWGADVARKWREQYSAMIKALIEHRAALIERYGASKARAASYAIGITQGLINNQLCAVNKVIKADNIRRAKEEDEPRLRKENAVLRRRVAELEAMLGVAPAGDDQQATATALKSALAELRRIESGG